MTDDGKQYMYNNSTCKKELMITYEYSKELVKGHLFQWSKMGWLLSRMSFLTLPLNA